MKITHIAIHHFGAPASTPLAKVAHLTEQQINDLHRSRWPDFPSELNKSYIGYNFVIYPSGEMRQYRLIGEETAAQKGFNLNTISICLAGNFTKGAEQPTFFQKVVLKNMLQLLLSGRAENAAKIKGGTILDLSLDRIFPHRKFAGSSTQCCGTGLSDTWARDLLLEPAEKEKLLTMLRSELERLAGILTGLLKKGKMGGQNKNSVCSGERY